MFRSLSFLLLPLLFLAASGCAGTETYSYKQIMMGTIVEIKVVSGKGGVDDIVRDVFAVMKGLEEKLSIFDGSSAINSINEHAQDGYVKVDKDIFDLIKYCRTLSVDTRGAFDITAAPLVDLWGFGRTGRAEGRVPGAEEIAVILSSIGQENILLDENSYSIKFQNKATRLDLGAIAPGYIVDRAISELKKRGIDNALVDAGGEVYCLGKGPKRGGWRVGVRHPRENGKVIYLLSLQNKAVATSGDYEKYFILDGQRYFHIIDPKTGYPAKGKPMSVTVVAENCATADAYSTALLVLGEDEGSDVIKDKKDIDAVFIVSIGDGLKMVESDGIKRFRR